MSSTSENTREQVGLAAPFPGLSETNRANLYHLLAKAFSCPLEMQKPQPLRLREIIPELPSTLQDSARAVAATWKDALNDPEGLALAYARHFLGPFEILSPPYASYYLEPDHRLMGKVSQDVARFYAEAGLEPGLGPQEAPDHVALEWEFMYFLTYRHVITGDAKWVERREEFRTRHLNHWLPKLTAAMAQHAEHPFYAALAEFLEAIMEPES